MVVGAPFVAQTTWVVMWPADLVIWLAGLVIWLADLVIWPPHLAIWLADLVSWPGHLFGQSKVAPQAGLTNPQALVRLQTRVS